MTDAPVTAPQAHAPAFMFPPAPHIHVAVHGENARFPVSRVFCIGRNYAAHAAEMGMAAKAVIFMKPPSALVPLEPDTQPAVPMPEHTQRLDHEVELVLALGPKAGAMTTQDDARAAIFGYAVGVDLTRRDVQTEAKDAGEPWDAAKAFDNAAPLGPIVPSSSTGHPREGAVWCTVNGDARQSGHLSQMLLSPEALLLEIAKTWRLLPGDLVFTGTPSGVGPLSQGDTVKAGVESVGAIAFTMG